MFNGIQLHSNHQFDPAKMEGISFCPERPEDIQQFHLIPLYDRLNDQWDINDG
jgi:hypothetical protein